MCLRWIAPVDRQLRSSAVETHSLEDLGHNSQLAAFNKGSFFSLFYTICWTAAALMTPTWVTSRQSGFTGRTGFTDQIFNFGVVLRLGADTLEEKKYYLNLSVCGLIELVTHSRGESPHSVAFDSPGCRSLPRPLRDVDLSSWTRRRQWVTPTSLSFFPTSAAAEESTVHGWRVCYSLSRSAGKVAAIMMNIQCLSPDLVPLRKAVMSYLVLTHFRTGTAHWNKRFSYNTRHLECCPGELGGWITLAFFCKYLAFNFLLQSFSTITIQFIIS